MSSEDLNNLSIEELKKLVKEKNEVVEKLKKEKLIQVYKKLQKKEEKLRESKTKSKSKLKSKPKSKQKEKSYEQYFQECIKNKTIPKDAPDYLKKALKRAMKEYEKGIKLEKSALTNFAEKYVTDGKPGLTPLQYFAEIVTQLKEFLRNHRNIKVRIILICEMENKLLKKRKGNEK